MGETKELLSCGSMIPSTLLAVTDLFAPRIFKGDYSCQNTRYNRVFSANCPSVLYEMLLSTSTYVIFWLN